MLSMDWIGDSPFLVLCFSVLDFGFLGASFGIAGTISVFSAEGTISLA